MKTIAQTGIRVGELKYVTVEAIQVGIPITKKGNEYITCSFEKNINKYVENYCNYDYYL